MSDKKEIAKPAKRKVAIERISLSKVTDVRLPAEFKKATAAIHIAPKSRITLIQRKAFNLLLANAISTNEHLEQATYSISLPYLMRELNFDSNNTAHIKSALKQLNVLQVQWEAINETGRENWGVATMIAEAEITNNRVYYSFAPKTKKMLLDPEFYGRINLEIQKQFQSQYAYALYENCVRFVDVGKTSVLTVEEWRGLLNAIGNYYDQFKNFSRKVLKPAIEEVNEVSDIDVQAAYVVEGKSVTHIQFIVERKKQTPLMIGVGEPVDPRLEKKLADVGFKDVDVADLIAQYEAEHLWSSLALLDEQLSNSTKKIGSKTAYLKTVLKNSQKSAVALAAAKASKKKGKESAQPKVDEPSGAGGVAAKRNLGMEELREEFNTHRRLRAQAIYAERHPDEQETLQLEFEHKSGQPPQTLESYRKSGFRSKLVAGAFDTFIQGKLLTEPADVDMLQFAVSKGLISR